MTKELTTLPEIKSLTDIVKHSKQLPTLRNCKDSEVNAAIMSLIKEVFVHYNESPSDPQLIILCRETKEALQGLTIPDIHIFKKNCLQGEYPLKFRLTNFILIEWIKQYKSDRAEAFAIVNSAGKEIEEKTPLTQRSKEIINEILDITKKKGELVYSTSQNKESEQAKRLQKWIEGEFDFNFTTMGFMENGTRFIHVLGKTLSRTEFTKKRFEEIHKRFSEEWDKQFENGNIDVENPKPYYIYNEIEKLIA